MHESHEVISAFIDGEPFEPDQLTAALADPVGRALLIDLLALRQLAQVDVPAAAVARRGRTALRLAMAAAAVVVALAGGYRWGVSTIHRCCRAARAFPGAQQRRRMAGRRPPMKSAVLALSIPCLFVFAAPTRAQTFQHLIIDVEGRVISVNGGEQPNTRMSTGAVVIGQTTNASFSKSPIMCGFAVSGAKALAADAVSGWLVGVTPLRVDNDAVTFRLHWTRDRDPNQGATPMGADVELTLRPGESLPIDMIPLPPAVTMPYQKCGVRATSLHVGVNYWPRLEDDRRLVTTELWLVERLPNGVERSQPLTLRGPFHQATPFYFDSLTDGPTTLDLFGEFTLAAGDDVWTLALKVRSRLVDSGRVSTSLRESGNYFRSRSVTPTLKLRPGEVIDVELPRLSENDSGAFAGRTYPSESGRDRFDSRLANLRLRSQAATSGASRSPDSEVLHFSLALAQHHGHRGRQQ